VPEPLLVNIDVRHITLEGIETHETACAV
jgi:hypothetical protein